MDDNVMRVLQMLQDGKITPQEAEMLIAALHGKSAPDSQAQASAAPAAEEKPPLAGLGPETMRPIKEELEHLGERISRAVSKVQPEKIVRKVQTQLRSATRAGAQWGASVSSRVRVWAEGDDARPRNIHGWPEHADSQQLEDFHLDPDARVSVDNPLGDVTIVGITEGSASVAVRKVAWAEREEEARAAVGRMEVNINGTDKRLDIVVSAPDVFREGTVDLELRVPAQLSNTRASTRFGSVEITGVDGLAEGVTASGRLSLHDLPGSARGETASGDMIVERVGGAATVATQSGDIRALRIGGGLTANAASGDVEAEDVEGGRLECKSVSGDVSVTRAGALEPLDIVVESISGDASLKSARGSIALKAVSGDVLAESVSPTTLQAQTVSGDVKLMLQEPFSSTLQVNTVSGDVTLGLLRGSNVRVALSTSSGDLRCEHDAQEVTATDTLWTGRIGTGAGNLNVQTISGDARILSIDAAGLVSAQEAGSGPVSTYEPSKPELLQPEGPEPQVGPQAPVAEQAPAEFVASSTEASTNEVPDE